MKILVCVTLIFWFCMHPCIAQWQLVGGGLQRGVGAGQGYCLYYDSLISRIYVVGIFNSAGGVPASAIASWDGLQWDSVGHGSLAGNVLNTVFKYGNKLFVGGDIFYNTPGYPRFMNATWDGVNWDTTGITANAPYNVYRIYNGDLYVGGAFTEVNHQPANLVARYDGTQFYPYFLPAQGGGDDVRAIEIYQGYMYVGGNFYDTITGVNDLERWNGTSFEPFGGGGLAFGGDAVNALQVYQNELYIGGGFRQNTGSPGNFIMKWNGTSFDDLNGGANSFISGMKVYNNELYVAGGFTQIGGVNISYMAKWNGTTWTPVISHFYNRNIRDFEFIGNDLYITGNFDTINGINFNGIARYANAINSVGPVNSNQYLIYPNPVADQVSVILDEFNVDEVILYDMTGKELLRKNPSNRLMDIDMKQYTSGIYLLMIKNRSGSHIQKIVKE